MQDLKLFFTALNYIMFKRDLNDTQLAEITGYTKQYISLVKQGKKPLNDKNMNKIASVFGFQLVDFVNLGERLEAAAGDEPPAAPPPPDGTDLGDIKALLAGQIKATHEQTGALGEIIAAAIKSVRDEERDKTLAERETHIKQLERDIKELKEDRDRLQRGGRKNAA